MDTDIEKELNEIVDLLRKFSVSHLDTGTLDPVVKMMLVALLHEARRIRDEVAAVPQRLVDRYCSCFIPHDQVKPMPALTLLHPVFRPNYLRQQAAAPVAVETGMTFTYRPSATRSTLGYLPLLSTTLLPCIDLFVVTHDRITCGGGTRSVSMGSPNRIWVGIVTGSEIERVKGLTLLIKGTHGLAPEHIRLSVDQREIDFATMREMETVGLLEPFDAQQASADFFSLVRQWKAVMLNMEDAALVCLTDDVEDRDLLRLRAYPRRFQQCLEEEALGGFRADTLWLELEFAQDYVVSEACEVMVNVMPVVNVETDSVTLTPAMPIARLQGRGDASFLKVLETSCSMRRQGFEAVGDEVIVRDFDAACYDNGDLYRDVRNLYNRFIDNYYAFVEYNGIKDGEALRQLRETVNKLGKCVGERNARYMFDSGTYVMKHVGNLSQSASVKVSYATTQGAAGNAPKAGETMECRGLPAIEQKVEIVAQAVGGRDKATADQRYELLRYYTLTNDRLYTRMDIDAFLRKEIMAEFGKDEFGRILIKIDIRGAGGPQSLTRGLYVEIAFKDKKNYDRAVVCSFDRLMRQKIVDRSCISMPVVLWLTNLDKGE